MEGYAIKPAVFSQENKAVDSQGSDIREKLEHDITLLGLQGGNILRGGVDGHRRALGELALFQQGKLDHCPYTPIVHGHVPRPDVSIEDDEWRAADAQAACRLDLRLGKERQAAAGQVGGELGGIQSQFTRLLDQPGLEVVNG